MADVSSMSQYLRFVRCAFGVPLSPVRFADHNRTTANAIATSSELAPRLTSETVRHRRSLDLENLEVSACARPVVIKKGSPGRGLDREQKLLSVAYVGFFVRGATNFLMLLLYKDLYY